MGKAQQPSTRRRHRIIERPRLFALLDESRARVKTLVAPAGYGKSTLAEQWSGRDGRRAAWFTARPSSTDVAALALGLARASTEIIRDCDLRLREHLRALPAPAENVETLAEILGEDLASWPDDAWLVLDEYQEIAGADDAERFVDAFIAASPVQLLIATRQRPSWVTGRRLIYGEILEVTQADLAMNSAEAAEVLATRSGPSASVLAEIAEGWPAVIGLASATTVEIGDRDRVPESLYRFFAEEVFAGLGERAQLGLATLAVAPVLDRELGVRLLGSDFQPVCAAALEVGILVERGTQLELHPLARSFLAERTEQLGLSVPDYVAQQCLEVYRVRREWDAAFDLVVRHGPAEQIEDLLLGALDELLETARLSTIERWCAFAHDAHLKSPILSLALAEVALRHGRLAEAQAHAEVAAAVKSELQSRALATAGRAAHLASREEEGLDLHRRAEAAASTEADRREAMWGQVLCATELALPEAAVTLEALSTDVSMSDPREMVRTTSQRVMFHAKVAKTLDLANTEAARQLLGAVGDPIVESSFLSAYGHGLALAARYDEALEVATTLFDTVRRYRLEFAVPWALRTISVAHAGRREWQKSADILDEAITLARRSSDLFAEQVFFAIRLRLLGQEGRHAAALAVEVPNLKISWPGPRAEALASRALVLACVGRHEEAVSHLADVGSSSLIEVAVLVPAVEAIVSLKRGDPLAPDRVADLVETAFTTGALDLLVVAYRATPELLTVLLRDARTRDRIVGLVRTARDEDLAHAVGESIAESDDPRMRLSDREREVYDLLIQGLTNRQIARTLFIEESTVKVHAHHIYDKTGVRSRAALAMRAALGRSDQATSAIDVTSADSDS